MSPGRTAELDAVMPVTGRSVPTSTPRPPASPASGTGVTSTGRGTPTTGGAATAADGSGQGPAVHPGAVLEGEMAGLGAGRRDVRVLDLVARDLVEQRRRDIAALEPVRRVVDHDRHDELRVVGRHHAGEGVPVHPARVGAAVVRVRLLRGAG